MDAVPLSREGARTRTQRAVPIAGPWASYFVAVLFLLLFPLLPLGAELLFTGKIMVASLTLVTATYAISLSIASRHLGVWALGFMVGLIFSMIFGWASAPGNQLSPAYRLDGGPAAANAARWGPVAIILGSFVLHLGERFVRHVQKKEPFPEFLNREVT
jgi:hypothetical protein